MHDFSLTKMHNSSQIRASLCSASLLYSRRNDTESQFCQSGSSLPSTRRTRVITTPIPRVPAVPKSQLGGSLPRSRLSLQRQSCKLCEKCAITCSP